MIQAHTTAFWRATLALAIGSFVIFGNLYTSQPLLPLLREAFGVSALAASLTVSVTTLTLGLSLLIYGPLSDALGRRPVMITTMALASLCALAIGYVSNFATLLVLRALQGLFLGGLPAVALGYMGDEFERRALLMAVGIYIAGNSLGGIGGRLLSGLVGTHWGWHSSFLVAAAASLGILLLFVWTLPPSRHFTPRPLRLRGMLADLGLHLRSPAILVACLIGGFNFFIFVNLYSYVTYLLSEAPYRLSPTWLGMLFLSYLSGTVVAAASGRLVGGRSQPLAMATGIGIIMAGTLVTLVPRLEAIIAGLFINAVGFFFAHTQAAGWISRHATRARASAHSLYLMCYYGGASLGGFYLGPYWHWQGWRGVVLGSLLVLAGTMTLAFWLRAWERRRELGADVAVTAAAEAV